MGDDHKKGNVEIYMITKALYEKYLFFAFDKRITKKCIVTLTGYDMLQLLVHLK